MALYSPPSPAIGDELAEVVADCRRRCSSTRTVVSALVAGRYPADRATLEQVARIEGLTALSLARVERDLLLVGAS